MNVTEAVHTRRSIRAFRPDPIEDALVRRVLEVAARAPSGGNLQPWRIYVVNGDSMTRLRAVLAERPEMDPPDYEIYPADLPEPYRTNRYLVGEQMYELLGIPREDKAGRLTQLARNGDFFGAPCALFCFVDRMMGPPQWSDLGMFLQTFMLLAVEAGLATCAQEYWSLRHRVVSDFVGAPASQMLFCGMALGRSDDEAAVNGLVTQRLPLEDWASWV